MKTSRTGFQGPQTKALTHAMDFGTQADSRVRGCYLEGDLRFSGSLGNKRERRIPVRSGRPVFDAALSLSNRIHCCGHGHLRFRLYAVPL